jgi:hypothetical protein
MAEARTWKAPLLSFAHLDSYLLRWSLQGFPHVLNVKRQTLLGPLHSHTLYHTPTNRLDVTLAHILLRFEWLLEGNTGSPRVRGNNAGYICHGKWGEWVCWAYLGYWGSSDGGGFQDLAGDQLVRETPHRMSKVLSPWPWLTANQSAGPRYNKIRTELDFPTIGKNLFIDLVERIAKELNVSNCWVCKGNEEWPW